MYLRRPNAPGGPSVPWRGPARISTARLRPKGSLHRDASSIVTGRFTPVTVVKSEQVGGAKVELVGAKKSETVKGNRPLSVGGDASETVKKKRNLKVDHDHLLNVGGKYQVLAKESYAIQGKELVLAAEDSFTLQVGSATIQVKKDGKVVIKGGKIEVTASGDMVLKASKISEN